MSPCSSPLTLSRLAALVGRRRVTFPKHMQHEGQFTAQLAKPLRDVAHHDGGLVI
jgi:hypothetical protein